MQLTTGFAETKKVVSNLIYKNEKIVTDSSYQMKHFISYFTVAIIKEFKNLH